MANRTGSPVGFGGSSLMRAYSHGLRDWIEANPTVKSWHERKARDSKNTAEVYASMLWKYWKESLAPRGYKDISQYVEEVKDQQYSKDTPVKRRWGKDLEDWYTKTTLREKSRSLCVWALTSFLKEHVEPLASYDFAIMERAEKFAQRKAHKIAPLTIEELRRLVNEASTRDKAIFLTQISGGLGVGEFLEFAKDWKNYEKAIRERTVPLRIDLVRPKTGVEYHTLLWDDSVNALADLLAERERTDKTPELLFVNQHKKALTQPDIMWSIRRLADRTGLDPKRPKGSNKTVYRIRPHEFRDYFKTSCENSGVPDNISEFAMGHKIDRLEYNKFAETKEGEERIRLALSKARPKLNVLTERGNPTEILREHPYLTEAIEWISLFKGIPTDQVEKGILAHLKRSPAFADALKDFKPAKWHMAGTEDDAAREVALGMPREHIFPSVLSYVQSLTENKPTIAQKILQKVIPEAELQKFLDEGWSFRSVINTHSVLVERPADGNEDLNGQAGERTVGA